MIWLSLIALIASTLLLAGSRKWKPEGWAYAWLYLIGMSAAWRILLWATPAWSPVFSRGLIFFSLGIFLWNSRNKISRFYVAPVNFAFLLLALLVMARSAFPNFDVDSMSYHLASIRWLFAKPELAGLQAQAQGVYLAYRFVGFEEFLGIPALDGDLPLWAGFLGGYTKVLALFSVLSIVPGGMFFFRYLAAFLLLVDDHFFFSGQNRFVYLHPGLIGLVCLSFWFLWRGLRGKPSALPISLGLFLGIAYDKYHGLFFVVLGGVLAIGSLISPRHRSWLKSARIFAWLRHPAAGVGALGCFALYGLNWIETGTAVYPYLVNGIGGSPGGAQQSIDASYFNEGFGALFRHFLEDKYKVFTYPGNLALKYFVILFVPVVLLWCFRPRKVNSRLLEFCIFAFLVTIGWVLMCNVINYETSRFHGRYPRFVFAFTICGIALLGSSIRNLWAGFRWPAVRAIQHVAGICLIVWIAATLDTRYFNITRGMRIGWTDIGAYWRSRDLYDPNVPPASLLALTDGNWNVELPALEQCILKAAPGRDKRELLDGKGMVLLDDRLNWPNIYFGGNAFRPDQNVGVTAGLEKFQVLLVSKKYLKALPKFLVKDETVKKLEAIWSRSPPLCESGEVSVFRL